MGSNIPPGTVFAPETSEAQPNSLSLQAPTTVLQQLGASFDIENVAVNAQRLIDAPSFPDEIDFDPLEHLQPGEELDGKIFATANSMAEMNQIRTERNREAVARQMMGDGPLPEILAAAAAIVMDPVSYIPVAGQLAKLRSLGRLGSLGLGFSVATEVGVSEAVLQEAQHLRTPEESIAAIMMGGVFGTAIGAATARSAGIGADEFAKLSEDFIASGKGADGENLVTPLVPESAGAQATPIRDAEDGMLAGSFRVGEAVAKLGKVGLAAPALELVASPFRATRDIIQRLVDTGVITRGEMKGLATEQGVEMAIRRHQSVKGGLSRNLSSSYKAYRKVAKQRGSEVLNRGRYYEEIGRAMRRNDEHTIPEVASAAKQTRKIFEEYKTQAQQRGLLGDDIDVKTADSYLSRVYNHQRIRAEKDVFKKKVEGYLRTIIKREEVDDDGEYGRIANEIINTILGAPHGRVPLFNEPKIRGVMKERTFNIPDAEIEDFLESNVLEVSNRYINTMAADIEFSKAFGKADAIDDTLKTMQDEIDAAMDAATSAKERQRIAARGTRDIQLVSKLMELIRGVSTRPSDAAFDGLRRITQTGRTLNFVRLLGMVTLSSAPDIGRIVMTEGLGRTMGGIISTMGSGFKTLKLGIKQAQDAGTAWEMVAGQRGRALFDLGDQFAAETKFERLVDQGGQAFGNLTLLNGWNTMLKGYTSSLVSTRILRTAEALAAGKKVSKGDIRRLAQAGIDEDMAKKIAGQAEHFDRQGTLILAGTENWTDNAAVEAVHNAVLRDVDNTIITPGRADAPLWTTNEIGKTIFQFKRFAAASTQRILVSGLQARDMQTMNGIMIMFAIGAMATAARDISSRGEVRERTTAQWINEGIDRSGVLAMFYEADAISDKLTGGYSIQGALAGQESSRFQSRDILGQVLGPMAGFAEDTASVVHGIFNKDFTQSDLHKGVRMMPLQNLIGLGTLIRKAEDGLASALDLPANQTEANKRQ